MSSFQRGADDGRSDGAEGYPCRFNTPSEHESVRRVDSSEREGSADSGVRDRSRKQLVVGEPHVGRTSHGYVRLECSGGGYFELTPLGLLTESDRSLVLIALKEDLDSTLEDFIASVNAKRSHIWRYVNGKDRSIIVTQVTGKSLFMWMIAGEGYVTHLRDIADCLTYITKAMGLRAFRGVCGERLARIYERRVGARRTGVVVEIGV